MAATSGVKGRPGRVVKAVDLAIGREVDVLIGDEQLPVVAIDQAARPGQTAAAGRDQGAQVCAGLGVELLDGVVVVVADVQNVVTTRKQLTVLEQFENGLAALLIAPVDPGVMVPSLST